MRMKRRIIMMLCSIIFIGVTNAQEKASDTAPKWTGQISAGWSTSRGNSHTDNLSASASAERRSEQDRITAGADYAKSTNTNKANQKTTTEDWWRIMGQYDYFFTQKFFAFGNGRYEEDKIALLDSRILIGAGAGYQLLETERTNLSFEGGLASKHEKYSGTPSTKNNDLTLQLGYKVSHQIVETVAFVHDLTYYPVVDNFSDYFVTTTAEFRGNFTKNMFSNFKIIYNRDATPAVGRSNSDIKYILGIGWNF